MPPPPKFPAWMARYDRRALRPPTVADRAGAVSAEARAGLRRWCFAGAGDGRSPLLQPWRLPHVDQRFAAITLPVKPGVSALVADLACDLDGSYRLVAASGLAALWLRLRTKINDACWWRRRQPDDPWDSGYAQPDAAALGRFVPRRATLVIAEGLPPDAVRACFAALAPRAADFRHPVRLLVLGGGLE